MAEQFPVPGSTFEFGEAVVPGGALTAMGAATQWAIAKLLKYMLVRHVPAPTALPCGYEDRCAWRYHGGIDVPVMAVRVMRCNVRRHMFIGES